jgi:hypothetical protein
MRDIWKAAESFGLDSYALAERMLVQMLYSGSFIGEKIDVYRNYVTSGPNTDIELAFISQNAYDSFAHGTVTDRYIFDRIERLALENMPLQEVCKLAYLRYYATEKKSDEDIHEGLACIFMRELLEKDIFFPFYAEYQDLLPDMVQFIDKTMIEYRTTPGRHCTVHYRLDDEAGGEYRTLEMKEMFDGIFVSEFVLFFGEQMQYYITEDGQEEGALTESGTIQKSDIMGGQTTGRYSLINDIMIGETLQDYDTVDTLIAEYYKKKFICEKLFYASKWQLEEEG